MSSSRDRWIMPSVTRASFTLSLRDPPGCSVAKPCYRRQAPEPTPVPDRALLSPEDPHRNVDHGVELRRDVEPGSNAAQGRRDRGRPHRPGHAPALPPRAGGPVRDAADL